MPPKPGFWYYDSIRAFRVYLVLALLGVGIHLSEIEQLSLEWSLGLFLSALVEFILLFFLVALVFLLLLRAFRKPQDLSSPKPTLEPRAIEPDPSSYNSRENFVEALRAYAEERVYKPGWVYYRSKELWPQELSECSIDSRFSSNDQE